MTIFCITAYQNVTTKIGDEQTNEQTTFYLADAWTGLHGVIVSLPRGFLFFHSVEITTNIFQRYPIITIYIDLDHHKFAQMSDRYSQRIRV